MTGSKYYKGGTVLLPLLGVALISSLVRGSWVMCVVRAAVGRTAMMGRITLATGRVMVTRIWVRVGNPGRLPKG